MEGVETQRSIKRLKEDGEDAKRLKEDGEDKVHEKCLCKVRHFRPLIIVVSAPPPTFLVITSSSHPHLQARAAKWREGIKATYQKEMHAHTLLLNCTYLVLNLAFRHLY